MAICTVQYFSNALRRFTTFTAILPNDLPPEMMGPPPFPPPHKGTDPAARLFRLRNRLAV